MGVKSVAYLALSERADEQHAGLTHSRGMCKGLAENGLSVRLFLSAPSFRRIERDGYSEIRLPRHGFWKPLFGPDARHWRDAQREIENCDIIHERYSINPLSRWLTRQRRVVLEVNDPLGKTWGFFKSAAFAPFFAIQVAAAWRVVTQTRTLRALLFPEFQVPIDIVPNGVDLDLFAPDPKKGAKWKSASGFGGKKLVAFVGSFQHWHGVELIPAIAESVVRSFPDAVFVLAGMGPLFPRVRAVIASKKLEKQVVLLGAVSPNQVASLLAASDVAIAPFDARSSSALSKNGFWWCPVKLFEYLAAGVPVVCSDYPETRTIVASEGVLVPPGNWEIFADAVCRILADPNEAEQMKERMFKRRSGWSWKERAKETMGIYNQSSFS